MTPKDLDELLGAYALDAVDDDERAEVDEYLAANPRARAEVEDYREVASLLAFSGAPAPDGLWDKIAATIDGPSRDVKSADELPFPLPMPQAIGNVVSLTAARGSRARRVAMGTLAAAAAILVLVLGVTALRLDNQVEDLQAAQDSSVRARAVEALADPSSTRVELLSEDGAASVDIALAADGTGYLLVDELPALADDQTYQLWGVNGDEVFSLGLLGSDPTAAAFPASGGLDALAITAEKAGGVAVSSQVPVASGAVA